MSVSATLAPRRFPVPAIGTAAYRAWRSGQFDRVATARDDDGDQQERISARPAWLPPPRVQAPPPPVQADAAERHAAELLRCGGAALRRAVADVCSDHALTPATLFRRGRAPLVVRARHDLWYRLVCAGLGFDEVGRRTGFDGATVYGGVRTHAARTGRLMPRVRA